MWLNILNEMTLLQMRGWRERHTGREEVLKAMKMDSLIPLVARVFNLFDNNRDGSANRVTLDISLKSR
jgi:hypothetical protein